MYAVPGAGVGAALEFEAGVEFVAHGGPVQGAATGLATQIEVQQFDGQGRHVQAHRIAEAGNDGGLTDNAAVEKAECVAGRNGIPVEIGKSVGIDGVHHGIDPIATTVGIGGSGHAELPHRDGHLIQIGPVVDGRHGLQQRVHFAGEGKAAGAEVGRRGPTHALVCEVVRLVVVEGVDDVCIVEGGEGDERAGGIPVGGAHKDAVQHRFMSAQGLQQCRSYGAPVGVGDVVVGFVIDFKKIPVGVEVAVALGQLRPDGLQAGQFRLIVAVGERQSVVIANNEFEIHLSGPEDHAVHEAESDLIGIKLRTVARLGEAFKSDG